MYLLISFIVSGDKKQLMRILNEYGGVPEEKNERYLELPIASLIKKIGDILLYLQGQKPIEADYIKIFFIREYDEPVKILVDIYEYEDFYCKCVLEVEDKLIKLCGIKIEPEITAFLHEMFFKACLAYDEKILNRPDNK